MSILPKRKDLFTNSPRAAIINIYKGVLIQQLPIKEVIQNELPSFSTVRVNRDGTVEVSDIFDMFKMVEVLKARGYIQ